MYTQPKNEPCKPTLKIRPMTVTFRDLQASDSDKVEWFKREQKIVQECVNGFVEEKNRKLVEQVEKEMLRLMEVKQEHERIEREKVLLLNPAHSKNFILLTKTSRSMYMYVCM